MAAYSAHAQNGHKTTSGVKFGPKFDFYVPDFLYGGKFRQLDHDFMYIWLIFCCACAETARILLQVKFLTPNLNCLWAVSYSTTNFGDAYYKIYAFLSKIGFCNVKFSEFGG